MADAAHRPMTLPEYRVLEQAAASPAIAADVAFRAVYAGMDFPV